MDKIMYLCFNVLYSLHSKEKHIKLKVYIVVTNANLSVINYVININTYNFSTYLL